MVTKELIVQNRAGIHARPASTIAKVSQRYSSEITLTSGTMTINAKSIMGIITLGAIYKTPITVTCDGCDENEAMDALQSLFENRFEEV